MARKLKTYITNLGFYELALAAPSMKAALEAWGMGHNAFHQGFAKESDDPRIVAATMARPGVVLRRAVGTKSAFQEDAELPTELWKLTLPKAESPRSRVKPPNKPRKAKAGKANQSDPAAILSFQKAKERRDREREKQAAKDETRHEKERLQAERAAAKAEQALERAQKHHDAVMAAIGQDQEKLDRRAAAEKARWEAQKIKLQEA